MPRATLDPASALPRSHVFLSFASGSTIRTYRLRRGVMQGGIAGAVLAVVWLLGSTAYLMFHDDLVASLMAREAAAQYAYEDRIADLRGQVTRETSLKLVGQTTLEGRLSTLAARASSLEARTALLNSLADHAGRGRPGASAGDQASAASLTGHPAPPRPQVEGAAAPADMPPSSRQPFAIRMAAVEEDLEKADAAQFRALASLGDATHRRAAQLRAVFGGTGLTVERLRAMGSPAAATAEGGPFVPLDPVLMRSSFGQAFDGLRDDLVAVSQLEGALPHVPLGRPLAGPLEVTSPFGARVDPFLGRAAMHTGIDLREGYGTEVRATAAGRVVSAGPMGGYGTMVEIDHGHGLTTRYAHLSSAAVLPGQTIAKDALIGEVGATGRATGPHLHYETRIDGEPVDPARFLEAGARLAALGDTD